MTGDEAFELRAEWEAFEALPRPRPHLRLVRHVDECRCDCHGRLDLEVTGCDVRACCAEPGVVL